MRMRRSGRSLHGFRVVVLCARSVCVSMAAEAVEALALVGLDVLVTPPCPTGCWRLLAKSSLAQRRPESSGRAYTRTETCQGAVLGSVTRPMNMIVPAPWSRMTYRYGRLISIVGPCDAAISPPVAAAARVPRSSTSITASCST